MKERPGLIMVFILCLLWGGVLYAQENPELKVQLGRNRIYVGESVLYQAVLNNVENPERPALPETPGIRAEPAGERSLDSEQITIVNGRMTRIKHRGMAYLWRLTPEHAGTFRILPPKVEVGGRSLPGGRPLVLKVKGPEKQDTVILKITAEPESVYPLQPFTVTLTVLVKPLPEPYQDRSPLSVLQRNPPALTIPWVEEVSTGLIPEQDWRKWLSPMQEETGFFSRGLGEGFSINGITGTFPTDVPVFKPPHTRVAIKDSSGKNRSYWAYTLRRTFRSERTGTFTFGPVNLKGTFATSIGPRGDLLGEDVYAVGKAVEVRVKDAPKEGRPPFFTGAIGRFTLSAELAPRKARVGDPITLTLRLRGEGTLDRSRPPDLESIPEVKKGFKVYEATAETKSGVRTFTYSLRPLDSDITAFPPVPFAYFDVKRERYVTLHTPSIPIEILEAEKLGDGEIVTAARVRNNGVRPVEARKEGLFANIQDPGPLRDQSVRPA